MSIINPFIDCVKSFIVTVILIRRLKRPLNIHMDHTSAVTCVDYAPTGKELVTGSYDKTIRIYSTG